MSATRWGSNFLDLVLANGFLIVDIVLGNFLDGDLMMVSFKFILDPKNLQSIPGP